MLYWPDKRPEIEASTVSDIFKDKMPFVKSNSAPNTLGGVVSPISVNETFNNSSFGFKPITCNPFCNIFKLNFSPSPPGVPVNCTSTARKTSGRVIFVLTSSTVW